VVLSLADDRSRSCKRVAESHEDDLSHCHGTKHESLTFRPNHFEQDTELRNVKANDLAERRTAAAAAKAALLRDFQATKDAAEPNRLARQAERLALATAREERHQERDKLKLEKQERQREQERIQAEAAEYQNAANVAARAQAEAQEKSDSMIARVINDEAARKAERDRRYANRKARQQD
jgi:hypothetical protein